MISDASDAVGMLLRYRRAEPAAPWRAATIHGDLYAARSSARAAVVLVPGIVPEGRWDGGLVQFAIALSRQGFSVLVPKIAAVRSRCLSAADAATIAHSVRALRALSEDAMPIGIAAISSAVCPAVLAALEPDLARRVDFVIAVGGYLSSRTATAFFTTGHYRETPGKPWRRLAPNERAKWTFARTYSDLLEDRRDQIILDAITDRKYQDVHADVSDLQARLGSQGRSVMALVENRDPERVPALIEDLPSGVRGDFAALDLSRRDLGVVRARFHILHYRGDATFPYTESLALSHALHPEQAELTLLNGPGHVDLLPAGMINPLLLWRAAYRLMAERHSNALH